MLFGLLWVSNYFIALGECTIAGSFASYYWAWNKSKDIGLFTTPASFARAILWVTNRHLFISISIQSPTSNVPTVICIGHYRPVLLVSVLSGCTNIVINVIMLWPIGPSLWLLSYGFKLSVCFVSCIHVVYVFKEVVSFRGLIQLMGVVCKWTCIWAKIHVDH